MLITHTDLAVIAGDQGQTNPATSDSKVLRKTSSWEITTFILPMSVGHFRRVLRDTPTLPQGEVEDGDTSANAVRWFTFQDVQHLRRHFEAQGRKPSALRPKIAPVVGLVHPYGQAGKTTGILHLATSATLSGFRVLVIDADPSAEVTRGLSADIGPVSKDISDAESYDGFGVLPLIARSYARHMLRANRLRLDQGETPQPLEDTISRALGLTAQDVIRPSRYPGIDMITASRALSLADMKLGDWQGRARTWQPWRALHNLIHRDGLAQTYDVIFCDTGAGAGPLTLAVATSCDLLVMPVPMRDPQAGNRAAAGLHVLSEAFADIQNRESHTARAMGQPGLSLSWKGLHLLLSGEDFSTREATAELRARFGSAVLPDAMPEVGKVRDGSVVQFYDLPPRYMARAPYTALRQNMDACWKGLLTQLIASASQP